VAVSGPDAARDSAAVEVTAWRDEWGPLGTTGWKQQVAGTIVGTNARCCIPSLAVCCATRAFAMRIRLPDVEADG